VSSGASLSLPDGLFAPHELVRQLSARHLPLYVLRQSGVGIGGKPVLAVAERYEGAAEAGPGGEDLARDARRIATLASPNLARVREVVVRGPDLVVIGEFVEGEKLRRFVNVYLNDEDVRFLGGLETPVKDGDTVTVLPAVAGGSR